MRGAVLGTLGKEENQPGLLTLDPLTPRSRFWRPGRRQGWARRPVLTVVSQRAWERGNWWQ